MMIKTMIIIFVEYYPDVNIGLMQNISFKFVFKI